MNLNELRARVRIALGSPTKQIVSDNEIDLLLNDAQLKMVKEGALLREYKQTMTKTGANVELHTSANAVSTANEANATTGWQQSGSPLTSSSSSAYSGAYGFNFTANANNDRAVIDLSSTVGLGLGRYYKLCFYAKHSGTGGDIKIVFASSNDLATTQSVIVNLNSSDTEWKKYELIIKFSTVGANRYFGIIENNETVDGVIHFDSFSVKEVEGYEQYKLPTDCIYVLRVDYDTDRIPFIDFNDIEEIEPTNWEPDWS